MVSGKTIGLLAAAAVGATIIITSVRAQPASKVTIGANPTSGPTPLAVSFTGTYSDGSGNPIPNATLYLFVNGVSVGTFTTGATGAFSDTFTFTMAGTFQSFISDSAQGL